MALIRCHECGTEVSTEAAKCPKCGATVRSSRNKVVGGVAVVVAVFWGWFWFGGGLEQQAATKMRTIENQVAADAIQQYDMAKRSGSAMDACVHAGIVRAAFLQAKDEAGYQQWKNTEASDCQAAGIPVN